jgi:4-amino-4-deoxy-L-arabinose transferase-like glycosyltransferase
MRSALPRALRPLLAAAVLLGVAWALFVPSGQSPDEPAHVAYVQVLAERLDLPAPDQSDAELRESAFSTEQRLARDRAHEQWQYAEADVKSEWDPAAERRWRAEAGRLEAEDRADGGGPNSAAGNPPLYYAYEALAYRAAAAGHYFDRLYAMRIWSVLLLAVAVAATWLLVGELTRRDRLAQTAGAGVVALQPMATFISASVNPDAALLALWALAFWLGTRLLLRTPPGRLDLVAFLVVVVAAMLTKASSLALLPPVALLLAVLARRRMREGGVSRARLTGLGLALALVAVAAFAGAAGRFGAAFAVTPTDVLRFASYLWQAYFPNLPGQEALPGLAAFAGYDVWIRSGWGAFGWLEVQFPEVVYALLAAVSVGLVAAAALAVRRGRFPVEGAVLAFFGLAALALVAALHWADYRQLVTGQGSFLQGRYLLPLLPLGGVLAAAAAANLDRARRPLGVAALLGGLFVLQAFSFGLVAARFYV